MQEGVANIHRGVGKLKEGICEADGTSDALSEGEGSRNPQSWEEAPSRAQSSASALHIQDALGLVQVAGGHLEDNDERQNLS